MKTLYLIRHAKAAYEEPSISDFDRPLTEKGVQQANAMAEELKTQGVKPSLIVSSPAVRALTTAQIMADTLKYSHKKIKTDEQIYSGGVEDLIEIIKHTEQNVDTLLLFGHNPNLTWLTHYLCEKSHMNIPTCGIVAIAFKKTKSWNKLTEDEGELLHFIHPPHEQIPSV